jgi:hypothetical protein
MAERPPTIEFEDMPLDQARGMSRGPRMDPELSHALTQKIQSLGITATRIALPDGTNPTTMKNRILRVAAELSMPVTVRKVRGGLLFWRSTDDDIQQAKEAAQRLQSAQRKPNARPKGRRQRA